MIYKWPSTQTNQNPPNCFKDVLNLPSKDGLNWANLVSPKSSYDSFLLSLIRGREMGCSAEKGALKRGRDEMYLGFPLLPRVTGLR